MKTQKTKPVWMCGVNLSGFTTKCGAENCYLVCTVGFAYVLPAETYVEAEAHKKRLRKMGYKKFLVYKRSYGY